MWNRRNSMEDMRRKKGERKGGNQRGSLMNHERLWTPGNKLMVAEREGGREMGYPGDGY